MLLKWKWFDFDFDFDFDFEGAWGAPKVDVVGLRLRFRLGLRLGGRRGCS